MYIYMCIMLGSSVDSKLTDFSTTFFLETAIVLLFSLFLILAFDCFNVNAIHSNQRSFERPIRRRLARDERSFLRRAEFAQAVVQTLEL